MKLRERLLHSYLHYRTRPEKADRFLAQKKIQPSGNCSIFDRKAAFVGAVQLQAKLYKNPLHFTEEMFRHTENAAKKGVQLLVFPENNLFQLLGLIPGIEALAAQLREEREGAPVDAADLFRFAAPSLNSFAHKTFSLLAQYFGIYIMAGSFPVPEGGKVYNRAFLYGPGGNLLGVQDKVHLTCQEKKWGFSSGQAFKVFFTPLGRLAMPVCMDATYFETFRVLASLGAEIVMVPIANPEPYNYWLALRGIWPRVQESLVYGVKSALVGELLGITLTGRAGVFAPLALTSSGDGVLAELPNPDREGLVTALLDLEKLAALRKHHPYLGDHNPALTAKHFPSVYHTI